MRRDTERLGVVPKCRGVHMSRSKYQRPGGLKIDGGLPYSKRGGQPAFQATRAVGAGHSPHRET
jgi:hypothetical protein